MVGLEGMNKEELLEVIKIKDWKIKELEEEISILKEILKSNKEDFNKW